MPIYQFVNEQGQEREVFFPMAEAPPIGSQIEHEGETLTRIMSDLQISADVENVVHKYPYQAVSKSKWQKGAGAYAKDGTPIITSRRNEREFCAQHGLVRR